MKELDINPFKKNGPPFTLHVIYAMGIKSLLPLALGITVLL